MPKKTVYGFCASGGGSKGAWGGGVSQFLVKDLNRSYEYYAATSTGSLLMSMVAAGKIDEAKEGYTSVTNKDIYKLCPYMVKKNKNGVYTTKMAYFKIGYNMLIRGQKTFGDSTKLRYELLPKFFKPDDFYDIKAGGKEMISCVTNLTLGSTEFKSSLDYDYEDFLDWVFASTCAAPFMSILEKDGYDYADGGYIENMPIQVLIDRGCTVIDVIDHRAPSLEIYKVRNALGLIGRMVDMMMWESSENDLALAKLKARDNDVMINIYKPLHRLTNNSLVFDKETMTKWWDDGYHFAKSQNNHRKFVISRHRKFKEIKSRL